LRAEGYQVVEAECYKDALAAFDCNPGISFVVADIALPDGNGCALALAIHSRRPDLRVLFVSGHVGSEVCRYYGLDVGNQHFLRKPFVPQELVARVKQVLKSADRFPSLYLPQSSTSAAS
jgi:DNA-binding response OmpR family regulator